VINSHRIGQHWVVLGGIGWNRLALGGIGRIWVVLGDIGSCHDHHMIGIMSKQSQ